MKTLKLLVISSLILLIGISFGQARTFDLDGRIVVIALQAPDITPFAARGQETWLDPHGRLLAHKTAVEEMFNIEIQFKQQTTDTSLVEIRNGVLVGETEADIYMIIRRDMLPLAAEGFLHSLTPYLGDYTQRVPAMLSDLTPNSFHGEVYAIDGLKFPPTATGVLWNIDLFEELGLPNLYDLYESGEWTWDVMMEIALTATRDTTGDGEVDMWGVNDSGGANNLLSDLASSNNAYWTRTVDGRVEATIDDPGILAALQFAQELRVQQNLPRIGSWDNLIWFGQGRFAMHINAIRAVDWMDSVRSLNVGVVPLPKGPNADTHVYPDWSGWGLSIPITVEHPEAILEVLIALFMLTDEYLDIREWEDNFYNGTMANWFIDRTAYMNAITSMEQAKMMAPNWEFIHIPEFAQALRDVQLGEKTPATAMAEVMPLVQERLDEVFNQ